MSDCSRREFLALGAATLSLPAAAQDAKGLVVHEWGVLSLVCGTKWTRARSGGLGREGAAGLPPFVIGWESSVKAQIEKWEKEPTAVFKPIVYFYPPGGQEMRVTARVRVPTGRPHLWWPPVSDFGPKAACPEKQGRGGRLESDPPPSPAIADIKPENGFLAWNLEIGAVPLDMWPAGGWWDAAREPDAAFVSVRSTEPVPGADRVRWMEKFVYYDALLIHEPAVEIDWRADGSVVMTNRTGHPYPHVFAVRVKDGKCESAHAADWSTGKTLALTPAAGAPAGFVDALVASGLYRKEADALAKIWREEFFATEGVRVLAVLAREVYDAILPIEIAPAPSELKRVMAAAIECLDDAGRARIDALIGKLADADIAVRTGAAADLRALRPLADERLRKALEGAKDAEVRARIEELLK